jgi:hypothetical protein
VKLLNGLLDCELDLGGLDRPKVFNARGPELFSLNAN